MSEPKTNEPISSLEVLLTSEAGDKLARQQNISFQAGETAGTVVRIRPDIVKQTIDGIGTSFTESSAFVLAHLEPEQRQELMQRVFGADGANFSLTRTHIGACDFCVEGRYSCADVAGDVELEHFSIDEHKNGFDPATYPGIKDPNFDLLDMIKQAQKIKSSQTDDELRIIASAWTAPAWMKNIDDWYIPGCDENDWQGGGGSLKPEHYSTYADYLVKFLSACREEGIDLWGLTPVNEPCGNNGQWESMHFTPETQRDFIKNYLGPRLQASDCSDTRLLVFDQNRDHMEEWADTIFSDQQAADFSYGLAVHWYSSTVAAYEDIFQKIHAKYPRHRIIHTEGCIDDLGKDAPDGVADPVRFKESGWFDNDDFWWNQNATDWAYTASWPDVDPDDHPIYTPVHRYARDIIVGLNNWLNGWIDWNIVLDSNGGPNHVGNFCGAPIMIDTESGRVHYTPVFHVLSQLSRTIRPGDRALGCEIDKSEIGEDDLHACATLNGENILSVQLLNTSKGVIDYSLQIGGRVARVKSPANSVQTIRVQL
jgi:glucosylceramidase